jgi:hypothetical protein
MLIGASAMGSACSADRTVAPLVAHDVQGEWQEPGLFPGSAFMLALTETAGVVTGTGTFAVEAGAGGTLVVSGSVRDDSLHLQVVAVVDPRFSGAPPDTSSFEAILAARDTINGTLTDRGFPRSIRLVRLR